MITASFDQDGSLVLQYETNADLGMLRNWHTANISQGKYPANSVVFEKKPARRPVSTIDGY